MGKSDLIEAIYPLSPMQEGMLFHTLYAPGSGVYCVQLNYTLQGRLNVAAFQQSWQQVMQRHAVLRTMFMWERRENPLQVVRRQVKLPWTEYDWRGVSPEAQQNQLEALLQADRQQEFDPAKAPLMRLRLIRLAEESYQFVWSFHHLLLDGWSVSRLIEEVFTLYKAYQLGQAAALAASQPYQSYIAWLQRQDLSQAEAFWRQTLAGFTHPTPLPFDHTPNQQLQAGSDYAIQELKLSLATTAALQALARQQQLTLNTLIQGAWAILLSRYSGQTEVLFGAVVSGRPATLTEVETIVGLFINTLPVRVQVSPQAPLTEWLKTLQAHQIEARHYDYAPLPQIQGWSEVARGQNLFESILVFENYPVSTPAEAEAQAESLTLHNGRVFEKSSYPLTLDIEPGPALWFQFSYYGDYFNHSTISRMMGHLQTLLEGMAAQPSARLADLPLLTAAERQQTLIDWNETQTVFPQDQTFCQLFERQAVQTPEATAVIFEGHALTYRELNRQANRLARQLVKLGVGPEVVVALLDERGLDLLIMILAVFKAGGAYLPLDPLHPAQRLGQILQRSRSPLVLTTLDFTPRLEEALAGIPAETQPQLLLVGQFPQNEKQPAPSDDENLPLRGTPGNLAYVIYTSGSTGQPKGAMVEQIGMINHLYSKITDLHLTSTDRISQNSSQCFDISVWQFLTALLVGGQVHIFKNEIAYDPVRLLEHVQQEQITILQVVPSMLRAIIQTAAESGQAPKLPALRWIVPTGEALTTELARQWLQLYPQIPLLNAYGSTECSDDQCHHPIWHIPPAHLELPISPIGKPLANMQVYILDKSLNPLPIGLAGELYIGGVGVGRGYLNEPERTAEVFVPNPFSSQPGQRLYKTGDLARYLPDGCLEFLGRVDFMVKIRGFRIELGEIEAALEQHPLVQQAVVLAPGQERLVAYLVPQSPALTVEEVRHYLKQKLPEYMLPAVFIFLAAMPLNPNGKIDRRALPAPEAGQVGLPENYVAPRNPIETQLAQLMAGVMGLEQVGATDNFFEIGGHSLLAVRLIAQIHKQFGQDLSVAAFFQNATVADLAGLLLRPTETSPYSPLVALQPVDPSPGQTRRPFFMAHPADGLVLSYLNLARCLGPDQPFYGLQSEGLSGERPLHTRIEAMAAEYIRALQTIQPQGPYRLGGWSMGSVVAFEMAQQLRQQGQQVDLLALIDHEAPLSHVLGETLANLADERTLLTAFLKGGRLGQELPPEIAQLDINEQLNYLLEQVRILESTLPQSESLQIHRLFQVFKANVQAVQSYKPQRYPGRIVLFWANDQSTPDQKPVEENSSDATQGWGQLSTEPVEVHLVPGNHYTMFDEPHVSTLAERLRVYLEDGGTTDGD